MKKKLENLRSELFQISSANSILGGEPSTSSPYASSVVITNEDGTHNQGKDTMDGTIVLVNDIPYDTPVRV